MVVESRDFGYFSFRSVSKTGMGMTWTVLEMIPAAGGCAHIHIIFPADHRAQMAPKEARNSRVSPLVFWGGLAGLGMGFSHRHDSFTAALDVSSPFKEEISL